MIRLTRHEGRSRVVTNVGWDAVDAGSVGAHGDRRAGSPVSDDPAGKTNGADAYGKTVWSRLPLLQSSFAEASWSQPGHGVVNLRSDGDKNEFVAGEITA